MAKGAGGEVKLYLDHVKITLKKITDEKVLKQLALRVVERAQLNIRENDQIDTGFMVNSGYAIWEGGSTYGQNAISAEGREMAPEESLASDAAAGVVFGANYAIYQEAAKPFLYPAAEAAAKEFEGEAERIYKENLPEEGPRA
jgi:hypothetical protein